MNKYNITDNTVAILPMGNNQSIIYEVDENLESNRNSCIKPNKSKKNSKNYDYRFSNKKDRNSDTSNFFSSNNVKSGLKSFLNKTFSNNSFKKNKKHTEKRESLLLFNIIDSESKIFSFLFFSSKSF